MSLVLVISFLAIPLLTDLKTVQKEDLVHNAIFSLKILDWRQRFKACLDQFKSSQVQF